MSDLNNPSGRGDGQWKTAISQALRLRGEIESFQRAWPASATSERTMPPFTWEQLERQLSDLCMTPSKASMVADLVSATRKQAPFKPAEMVLREILCLVWALVDEDFDPGEGGMT